MHEKSRSNRRQFIQRASLVVPTVVALGAHPTLAAEQLTEDDPTAQALKYLHDASASGDRTDTSAICGGCQLYTGAEGSEWGPCALFPGKDVNAAGWCTAYVKKA